MRKHSQSHNALLLVDRAIARVEQVVILISFLGMAFLVLAGIIARLGNIALPWTNEAAQLLLVWLIFTGANLGTRHREHVGVTLLPDAFSGRARSALLFFAKFAVVVFCAYVVVAGIQFVQMQKMMGGTTFSLPIDIPKYLVALILPLSFFGGAVHAIRSLLDPQSRIASGAGDGDLADNESIEAPTAENHSILLATRKP